MKGAKQKKDTRESKNLRLIWKKKPWAYVHEFSPTDIVVYDLSKGNVSFRLNNLAARTYLLLDGKKSLKDIVHLLKCDVQLSKKEICELTNTLLLKLQKKNLVEHANEDLRGQSK